MYNTSQKFKDAIYEPDRITKGRVTFDISDVTAVGDVSSITVTSESPLSVKAQLINKVRNSSNKTATLEKDRFLLDGSFSFADDTLANNGELGWSSASICASDGSFRKNVIGAFGGSNIHSGGSANSSKVNKTDDGIYEEFTNTVSGEFGFVYNPITIDKTKNWLIMADMKKASGTFTNFVLRFSDSAYSTIGTFYQSAASTSWKTVYVKLSSASISVGNPIDKVLATANTGVSVGDKLDVRNIRVYELSTAEFNEIDTTLTGQAVLDRYPFYEVQPSLTFNFNNTHSSAGLTVTFDQLNGEYATDFDMSAYDSAGAVIDSKSITGNTDIIAVPFGQLFNYKKVSVTIKKWSKPNRRARVMEVDFGFVKQYDDNSLISMNLVEEMDMLTGKVPSAEFKFTIDNSDRLFNILNPVGFYKYLQQRQQVIGEIGLDIGNSATEWVQIGNYLLQEWQSDEGSLTATFTARGNLDLMSSFDFERLTPTTKTLYQLAVDMFTLCGITNYSIDTALQSITTNSLVEKANCRDILQMIAIAGCANLFVTRGNIITLKCNPLGITTPVDTADFDNMYQEPQIALDKAVRRVEVTYFTDLATSAIVGVNSTTNDIGDTLKLEKNTLINNSTRATAVANWFFAQLKYRATYRVNWRGNPALELNDVIALENTYGDNMTAYVTRNELDYAGYLQARTQAKGVVN